MEPKQVSLRTQFTLKLFIILLLIALISGGIQIYLMKKQISENVENKSSVLTQSIEQGMAETKLASESIEHQIDLRLESYSKQIADKLAGKPLDEISDENLRLIKDELGLTGITLFARKGNDIVGTQSTEPSEIGFSFKRIGYPEGYNALNSLYQNKKITFGATYSKQNMYVLPISQSGSHEKPVFIKYAYYYKPGTNYIINPYIEANEIYRFTKEVGPNSWIKRMMKKNEFIEEIAVLDPRVFENPELETKLFPPLKRVLYGEYSYKDSKDKQILINMMNHKINKSHYIQKYKNENIYKIFLPTKGEKVVYIALDYKALSNPLYRQFIILMISGLVSLIALFLLTARFFNRIYEKIQKIIGQIKLLESGDLTAKSEINDGSELDHLSKSTNRMVEKLNNLVKDTQEQATKTQTLSMLLEAETSQSVERMYDLSTKTTIRARDQLLEIRDFLDVVECFLEPNKDNEKVKEIMGKLEIMKEMAQYRTHATTEITITLSDLLKSLHGQSSELSGISNSLLEQIGKFKL